MPLIGKLRWKLCPNCGSEVQEEYAGRGVWNSADHELSDCVKELHLQSQKEIEQCRIASECLRVAATLTKHLAELQRRIEVETKLLDLAVTGAQKSRKK